MLIHRIINTKFSSCTYVIEVAHDQAWVVDCGDVPPLLEALNHKTLCGILLTHGHFDHIYGLNDVCRMFPEAMVYTNAAGRDALLSDRQNLSRYHETPFTFHFPERIIVVGDNETIPLSDTLKIRTVATPGHHPSCLTYVTDNVVFTGDSFIPNVGVVTILPGGDKALAAKSEELILELSRGSTIYAGHY